MARRKKKWIQKAIKRPGRLRRLAKRRGALTKKGTIKKSFLRELVKKGGSLGSAARLALKLATFRKRG